MIDFASDVPLFVACSSIIDQDTAKKANYLGFDLVMETPFNSNQV